MKQLAEALRLLHPYLFAQANRMIMARAEQINQIRMAAGYQHVLRQKAFEEEAWKLALKHTQDSHLRGKALDRERRKAFNRALRKIEKRGHIEQQKATA